MRLPAFLPRLFFKTVSQSCVERVVVTSVPADYFRARPRVISGARPRLTVMLPLPDLTKLGQVEVTAKDEDIAKLMCRQYFMKNLAGHKTNCSLIISSFFFLSLFVFLSLSGVLCRMCIGACVFLCSCLRDLW